MKWSSLQFILGILFCVLTLVAATQNKGPSNLRNHQQNYEITSLPAKYHIPATIARASSEGAVNSLSDLNNDTIFQRLMRILDIKVMISRMSGNIDSVEVSSPSDSTSHSEKISTSLKNLKVGVKVKTLVAHTPSKQKKLNNTQLSVLKKNVDSALAIKIREQFRNRVKPLVKSKLISEKEYQYLLDKTLKQSSLSLHNNAELLQSVADLILAENSQPLKAQVVEVTNMEATLLPHDDREQTDDPLQLYWVDKTINTDKNSCDPTRTESQNDQLCYASVGANYELIEWNLKKKAQFSISAKGGLECIYDERSALYQGNCGMGGGLVGRLDF